MTPRGHQTSAVQSVPYHLSARQWLNPQSIPTVYIGLASTIPIILTDKNHYCETCDREFKNAGKLAEHIAEHEVCGRDGCQFVAHPKVIAKHVQMQHDTGLFSKIGNLYTPQDIANWIAERKRLYPTKENMQRRQAEREEKMKRGERLEENKDRFGREKTRGKRFSGRNRNTKDGRGSFRNFLGGDSRTRKKSWTKVESHEEVTYRKLPSFPGTASFVETKDADDENQEKQGEFSDIEWEGDGNSVPASTVPAVSNALIGLMSMYASESEAEQAPGQEQSQDTGSGPEEAPVERKSESTALPSSNECVAASPHGRQRRRHHRSNTHPTAAIKKVEDITPVCKIQYKKRPRRATLLEKLISSEIRHERNVILQCIRYIVKGNFLDQESTNRLEAPVSLVHCIHYIVQNKFFCSDETQEVIVSHEKV